MENPCHIIVSSIVIQGNNFHSSLFLPEFLSEKICSQFFSEPERRTCERGCSPSWNCRRSRFKQDMPAELIFLSEYRQKSRGVLQKDRNTACQTVSQTLRQWFLKKRPVCPTS